MTTIMCLECGVMPCKRGAKKYCSRECCLKNTSLEKQEFNREALYAKRKTWNKGMKYSEEMKARLDLNGLAIGIGFWKGKERPNMRVERKERIVRNCLSCSSEMRLAPWEDDKKFCSSKCYHGWHRGPNSPVYKGDRAVARLRNRIAQLPEYRAWHAFILKRDNYRCTICQATHSKQTPLEVDHIKRFLFIANEYKIFTPDDARNCAELWDTENGRTLCKPCHRIQDTYGTKGLSKHL